MSPRSRLYHLPIAGVGTAAVESMTSYVMRLATAHLLLAGSLIGHYLAAGLVGSRSNRPAAVTERVPSGRQANGLDAEARAWVETVGDATLRTGLATTTMLRWSQVLPRRGVLGSGVRHCPLCLVEMDRAGVVYEPLVWHLAQSVICLTHRIRLRERCSECGSSQAALTRTSRPGMCRSCDSWLGAAIEGGDDRSFSAWDEFRSMVVADLVANPPAADLDRERDPAGGIRRAMESLGLSAKAFARRAEVGDGNLSMLLSGRTLPSLLTVTRLCAVGGWSPSRLLSGEAQVAFSTVDNIPSARSRRTIDWNAVDAALVAAMTKPGEATSLKTVATQLGMQPGWIRARRPEFARAITARRDAESRASAARRTTEAVAIVVEVTRQLLAEGASASRRQVEARLPPPLMLREPALQIAWKAALVD